MYVEKAAETTYIQKTREYKVDEIDGRCINSPDSAEFIYDHKYKKVNLLFSLSPPKIS